ncbi:MAG: asparagine synthase (glutamine-hydrolyzing) [Acidobacteriota bacterium]
MCGIAGAVSNTRQDLTEQAKRMADAIAHRGPDDWGLWNDAHCALSHRRLAIIDLSEAGRNPLASHDQTIWITFNGEIYNFQSLRDELARLGYRFRTRTDTETIVYAYQHWGTDCLKHLRGMFAFAIWDAPRKRLFLARDRVGKKPLFYTQSGNNFFFASELQGLLANPEISREPNPSAIDAYLSWGYVPAPDTGFKNIFKLPPAHYLTLDVCDNHFDIQVARYWSLDYTPKTNLSEDEASAAIREKLTKAVRLRMISDVPLGAFLSGGIDSSIVVGLMAQLSDKAVKTFSIGFKEAAYNETEHARRIANLWSTDHQEFIVEPDALAIVPKLVRHYGEPYADSSAIPTFYVAQMTRQSVTVALNGDGGDESFAGYERYLGNRLAERANQVPGFALSANLLKRVLPDSINPKSRARQAKRFLSVSTKPMAERYGNWVEYFREDAKARLYAKDFRASLNGHKTDKWFAELFERANHLDPVDAAMCVDVASYLPFDLLVKVDITSMANSLEARSPFLDHEVMEFAARLPVDLKLRGKEAKYLLKRAFKDLLPDANVYRRKMGFGVPIGDWFRTSLRNLLEDSLLSEQAMRRGYFNQQFVERMVHDHIERRADHSFALWNLLMLELWHREFID